MSKKHVLTASIVLFKTDVEEVTPVVQELNNSSLVGKIYLIDNSPTNELESQLKDLKRVEYIFTGENLGFGTGHNIGIKKAQDDSEFHLVLNADIKFNHEILTKMHAFMQSDEKVGLLAPKILNFDGTLQYSAKLLPTPANLIVRRFLPIKSIQDRLNYRYELQFWEFDQTINVPYVMGCFMFMRTKALKEVGGFDERFFMYPEDIDLTRRIHERYRTLYFPEASIYHKHGKGSYKSSKLLYYHVTSMVKYFNKWGWVFDRTRRKINEEIMAQFDSQ